MLDFNRLQIFIVNDDSWDNDLELIKQHFPNISDWGLGILKEGLLASIKSVIVEPFYTCKDHRNLFSNFYSKKFIESSPYTNRLHFFSKEIINIQDFLLNPEKYKNDYVGYSIIRPILDRCLGRTVIDPLKLKYINKDNFFCLRTPFITHIGGRKFEVEGYPYMSQDSDVTVCAHAALWGVCRYLSERYSLYSEMYPFEIVNLTKTSFGRTFPYHGMTYMDYCEILSSFGAYPILFSLKKNYKNKHYDPEKFQDLYTYVESGFPVLASYHGHVATIIGHTIDYTKKPKVKNDGFIDSSSFLKYFIVVDDNLFPYQLLGSKGDEKNYGNRFDEIYNINSILTAVCPLPEKVFMKADLARKIAMISVGKLKYILKELNKPPWVTRLFLTTNSAFKRRKLEKNIIEGNIDILSYMISYFKFPHFIWVMEISSIELYKDGFCLGEIVIDSTANATENQIIYIRIGNSLFFSDENNKPQIKQFRNESQVFYQFTHNLGEK